MKKAILFIISLCLCAIIQAQVYKTVNITPGGLFAALTPVERNTVTHLTITGTIDARDFTTMKNMPSLAVIDINSINIVTYTGTGGPVGPVSITYPANEIPSRSFQFKFSLVSISLPTSVTSIGLQAFQDCSNLSNIELVEGIISINDGAFQNCDNLNEITIPSTVSSVGAGVVGGCNGLSSVVIKEGVTTLGNGMFQGCTSLTELIIPSTVNSMGQGIISGCTSLAYLEIKEGITAISQAAFTLCPGLTKVIIPSSVNSIGQSAFSGCTGLTELIIPSTVTTIDDYAFDNCTGLTTVTMLEGVQSIGMGAFSGCTGLNQLIIPSTVNSIGDWAFLNCTGLNAIYSYRANSISVTSSAFFNVDKATCIIFVPMGSRPSYLATVAWNTFSNIVELAVFVSHKIVTMPAAAGSAEIEVYSGVAWNVNNAFPWLTVNPVSGSSNQTLTLTATANPGATARVAFFLVTSVPNSEMIIVRQQSTPIITWVNPSDITYGTALSATQLNATASVPGAFYYTPCNGIVIDAGAAQNLALRFIPTDNISYETVCDTVQINVNKKLLTIGAPTLTTSKEYDSNTDAMFTVGTLSGVLAGDNVTVSATATYDNKNVGTGKTITVSYTLGGTDAGNYTAPIDYTVSTGEITAKQLTVNAPTLTTTKIYDGTTAATVTAGALTNVETGDIVTVSATANYDNKNIGTGKTITVSYTLAGIDARNYTAPVNYTVSTGEITQKQLTVNAPTLTTTKIYDGTTTAAVTAGALTNVETGDNVTVSATATYDNNQIGTGKTITVTYTIGGTDAGNYITPVDYTLSTGEITAKQLTVNNPTLTISKIYDGTTTAAVTANALTNVEIGDNVTVSATATYDNSQAGTGKTITVVYTIGGTDAGNYTAPVDYTVSTGEITRKQLTVNAPTLTTNKVYDGTTTATVTANALTNVETGDNVTVSATATYDNSQVGTGKTITVVYTIGGTDAGNYTAPIDYTVSTGEITAKQLTVNAPTLTTTKVYDGTTTAAVTANVLTNVETGDNVTVSATAIYDNSQVGTGKTITVNYTIGGTDAGNYSAPIDYVVSTGEITRKQLTINNPTLTISKVYDGTTTAAVTANALTNVETGDNVTVSATATYDNSQAGTGKTITVTYTIGGTDAGNYITPVDYTISTGEITRKQLTINNPTLTISKVYDGTTTAAVTANALTNVETGDNVTVSATANYDNSQVGTGKTITVSYIIAGTDAGNYTAPIDYTVSTGEITRKQLNINSPTLTTNKVYNGTTTATVTANALTNVETGDNVSVSATANYDNRNVGTGKTITVIYTIGGTDAGNYTAPVDYTVSTGEITRKQLTVNTPSLTTTKIYDGTTTATVTANALSNVEGSDNVSTTATATYDNHLAGTDKTITVSYTIAGTDAGNYITPVDYTISTGEITPKQLTISDPLVTTIKMYDGNTTAEINNLGSLTGVETIDNNNVEITAIATYNNSNIGDNKTITVRYTLQGTSSANYITPIDFVINGAKILEEITLSETFEVPVDGGCQGESVYFNYEILTGTPTEYRISFGEKAINAGFENISYTTLQSTASTGTLYVTVPENMVEGEYQAQIQFRNEIQVESPVYTVEFIINLSNEFLIEKFDDVILVDNSTNRFTSYQWYKDGEAINGASNQFYNDTEGLSGSYYVEVETTGGETLRTCSKAYNSTKASKIEIEVFPNPIQRNESVLVELSHITEEELTESYMNIYDLQGRLVKTIKQIKDKNYIQLLHCGEYIGKLITKSGEALTYKIVVID